MCLHSLAGPWSLGMLKLIVKQASVDYYGFFTSPAFSLIGEGQKIPFVVWDFVLLMTKMTRLTTQKTMPR